MARYCYSKRDLIRFVIGAAAIIFIAKFLAVGPDLSWEFLIGTKLGKNQRSLSRVTVQLKHQETRLRQTQTSFPGHSRQTHTSSPRDSRQTPTSSPRHSRQTPTSFPRHSRQTQTSFPGSSRPKKKIACDVPTLNPFHKDAMEAWTKVKMESCSATKLSKVEGNKLIIDNTNGLIKSASVEYIIRGRKKNQKTGEIEPPVPRNSTGMIMDEYFYYEEVLNEDFHVHFSTPIQVVQDLGKKQFLLSPLIQDFLRVTLHMRDSDKRIEHHAHISDQHSVCTKHGKKLNNLNNGGTLPFNIAMVMVDSISLSNAYRQTPKLMEILEKNDDALIFKKHGIHGDGTTCQVMAFLAGQTFFKEQDIKAQCQYPNKNSCDDTRGLVFKDFHKAGYTTMYNEDSATGGSFQYSLNGFKRPPTDWYPRPYYIAARGKSDGCGKPPCVCETQEVLDVLKLYTRTCEQEAKFTLTMLNQAHDDMNILHMIEDKLIDIVKFFNEDVRRNNTILFLFSDHGARVGISYEYRNTKTGRLEEFLPFYSIILPPGFKNRHKDMYANLKANTEVLTSHFDVYSTLKHMLSYPRSPEKMKYGQSLFTKINPSTRTCNTTGIPEKFCSCQISKKLSTKTKQAKYLAQAVIDHINKKMFSHEKAKNLCARLTLKNVISLERNQPKIHDEKMQSYTILFRVSPSNATFEERISIIKKTNSSREKMVFDTEISRTNLYGNQPACIKYLIPKLSPFCYCKTLLKG